jgi:O-antigen/teichoic acid export membrane protein
MSRERTIAKNTAWLALQPLLMNVVSLAATRYIADRLGVVDFGRFNLGYTFVAMFAPLTNLGLRTLSARYIPQHRDTAAEYLGRILVLRTFLALLISVAVVLAAPLSGGGGQTRSVIMIAAMGLIVTTISGVLTDGFQAFEMMRPVSVASFLGGVVLTLLSVVVIKSGGGIRSMAWAYLLGPLCTLALLSIWSWRQPFRPRLSRDLRPLAPLLRQASPFFGIILLEVVSARVDVLVVARVLGEAHLGCYTAAMGLIDRAMYLADGAATALLPAIAHMSTQAPAETTPLLRKSALAFLLVGLPLALATTLLSPFLIGLIFGPRYTAAVPLLAIGIWRLPSVCLALIAGYSLLAVKRQDLELRTYSLGILISMALVLPAICVLGPTGGALVLGVRPLIVFLLRIPYLPHRLRDLWQPGALLRLGVALALMAVPLTFVPSLDSKIVQVALVVAAGGIYVASLAVMRVELVLSLLVSVWRRVTRAGTPVAWAAQSGSSSD